MKITRNLHSVFGVSNWTGSENDSGGVELPIMSVIYCSLEGQRALQRGLERPTQCCICGAETTDVRPEFTSIRQRILEKCFRTEPRVLPQCDTHFPSRKYAQFLVEVIHLPITQIVMFTYSRDLIEHYQRLYSTGDFVPPWRYRGGLPPDGYWRNEREYVHVWCRFWSQLPLESKSGYLRRWDVPLEWEVELNKENQGAWFIDAQRST